MNRGLLTLHAGVCIGVAAGVVLTIFVGFGSMGPVRTLFVGLVFSLPYILFALTALAYDDSRLVLWLLLGGVTLLGGTGTIVRLVVLQVIVAQQAPMILAGMAYFLAIAMSGLEFAGAAFITFGAVAAYPAFDDRVRGSVEPISFFSRD